MIKIRLEKWEKTIVMQVLEMDEELRGVGEIFDNGDMTLESNMSVSISNCIDTVYIRGDLRSKDWTVSSRWFETYTDRDEYYNRVVRLFDDYNNRGKEPRKKQDNIFLLE